MKNQTYQNHRKFYAPHHFIYLPVLVILLVLGIYKSFTEESTQLTWTLFSILIFLILYLAIMVRQHYALGNQDRILRLEFKQRYFEVFGKRSDEVESQLTFPQIAALRFAYDDQFKILLEKTLVQNLSSEMIKKSINDWRPDFHRV